MVILVNDTLPNMFVWQSTTFRSFFQYEHTRQFVFSRTRHQKNVSAIPKNEPCLQEAEHHMCHTLHSLFLRVDWTYLLFSIAYGCIPLPLYRSNLFVSLAPSAFRFSVMAYPHFFMMFCVSPFISWFLQVHCFTVSPLSHTIRLLLVAACC